MVINALFSKDSPDAKCIKIAYRLLNKPKEEDAKFPIKLLKELFILNHGSQKWRAEIFEGPYVDPKSASNKFFELWSGVNPPMTWWISEDRTLKANYFIDPSEEGGKKVYSDILGFEYDPKKPWDERAKRINEAYDKKPEEEKRD